MLEVVVLFAAIVFAGRQLFHADGKQVIFTVAVVLLLFFAFANTDLPRHLSDAVRLMAFYMCGYYARQYDLLKRMGYTKRGRALIPVFMGVQIICVFFIKSWQSSVLPVTLIAGFAGIIWICIFSIRIEKMMSGIAKRAVHYIGQNTLTILALHLLAFCFVKLLYVCVHGLEINLVETTGAIPDYAWCPIYIAAGVAIPLLLHEIWNRMKKMVLRRRRSR